MVIAMDEVLKNMGWDNGFHLPVANVENQALEKEIERLMLLKGQTCIKLDLISAKFDDLTSHLNHLSEQQIENQKIILAEQGYLEEQRTKQKMLNSENNMLHHEIRNMEKEYNDVHHRIETRQTDLTRAINKIEKLKTESAWDAEALAAWDEALSKRQIDNEMIKKFSKEDEKKTIELEAKRQQLQMDYTAKREAIHHMASDLTHHELVMERTSKYYKQLKAERAALISQWQGSAYVLKQRDAEITAINREIHHIDEAIQFKLYKLEEQDEFLENEVQNNKELDEEIANLNNKASRLRKQNMVLIDMVQTYISEENTLKRTVTSSARNLDTLRASKKKISNEILAKENEVKELRAKNELLKKKQADISNNSASASERANQLEVMIKSLNKEKEILMTDIETNQNVLFRQQQCFNGMKEKETDLTLTITGVEISSALLKKNAANLNNELSRQKEAIYDLDYRLHFLQTKIMDINTTKSDVEKEALDEKINKLEAHLDELNDVKQLLDKQVLCIEDEMRRLTIEMTLDNDVQIALKNKLQHELLLCEGGKKQLHAVKQRCQQFQVEENILHLRVNQVNASLKRKGDTIFTLTKCKLEMTMALQQREIEINTQKELMLVKRRNLDEEKSRLKQDLMSRLQRIQQFKTRYTITINSLDKTDDGKQFTMTEFKIKLAQEKVLLQEEGDALDHKIRMAEKEIRAMENTLKIVNVTNDTYKQSLSTVDEASEDTAEMARLEQQLSDKTQELYKQKAVQSQCRKIIADKMQCMKDVANRFQQLTDVLHAHEADLAELLKDAVDREQKIQRAQHQLRKLIRSFPNADRLPKMDAHVRTLQDLNRNILQQLTEVKVHHLEVSPLITRYFKEQHIVVPPISRLYVLPSPSSSEKSLNSNASSISEISTVIGSASSCSSLRSIPSVNISFGNVVPPEGAAAAKTPQNGNSKAKGKITKGSTSSLKKS